MQTLGNILWLIFVGIWLAIGFVVAGIIMFVLIITIPFGIQAFKLAGFALVAVRSARRVRRTRGEPAAHHRQHHLDHLRGLVPRGSMPHRRRDPVHHDHRDPVRHPGVQADPVVLMPFGADVVSDRRGVRRRRSPDGFPLGVPGVAPVRSDRMAKPDLMERVVNLCKRRGFVFPSSEIYGGFRSTWDYGPFGVLLKRNVKDAWWRSMVQLRDDIVGLDAAILMHPRVWEASGHVQAFTDPLVDCRNCKERFRADHLPESGACPNCGAKGSFTEARQFNLMFKTHVGPVEDDASVAYLRPGDRPGHLRQLPQRPDDDAQEAAVRHRPDRQGVPQRDHAGELHLPHPRVRDDGAGVLRAAGGRADGGTSTGARSGCAGSSTSASPRTSCACGPTTPTSCRTTRPGRRTSSSRTRGAGVSSRASRTGPTSTSRSTRSSRART